MSLAGDRLVGEELAGVGEAGLGLAAEVEHQLDELAAPRVGLDGGAHRRRHHLQEQLQIVRRRSSHHVQALQSKKAISFPGRLGRRREPLQGKQRCRALQHFFKPARKVQKGRSAGPAMS